MFQWDQTRVRVKKCALFCWMDHHVGAFIHVFFDWQNQTDACAVDHVIMWYQAIHMINKYVVLNGFLKSNYASSWLRGASVGQWSLSLNSFKWDDCMFQKMRWWMNMWHQTLPRPSDVNADSSVFVCSSELSQFIHQSYERLNILRQYHCGSNQMHFLLSHLDQIWCPVLWLSRIHCDGIWWFSKLWTGSTETSSWGKEWNECVFTHLGPSEMNVNCSLIEVMGILYFVLLNPAACHPAGCIKTFSSIWRAQASDERWWCQKYHHTVIVIMEQRISWLLEISWTHSQTLNQLKCEPQDWLWQPQGKVGAWGSDGIMWVAEESWLSFV